MLTPTIINSERYCEKMERPFLLRDTNARTAAGIRRLVVAFLDHPSYFLDLVPLSFPVFRKPKVLLAGHSYASDVAIKTAVKLDSAIPTDL